MARPSKQLDVYLEVGTKRVFAGAVDWPGWARSGRDEEAALQALIDHGPRYAAVVGPAKLGYEAPADLAALHVVERLPGSATTDFGAPSAAPAADAKPVDDAELARLTAVLEGCWRAFDAAVAAAEGRELRRGPRGGGRDLEKIEAHVLEAEVAYLSQLGSRSPRPATAAAVRETALVALAARVHAAPVATPSKAQRPWPPRYFVRRAAWHVLDHAWEIEDRSS
jgi:hypothetical protein